MRRYLLSICPGSGRRGSVTEGPPAGPRVVLGRETSPNPSRKVCSDSSLDPDTKSQCLACLTFLPIVMSNYFLFITTFISSNILHSHSFASCRVCSIHPRCCRRVTRATCPSCPPRTCPGCPRRSWTSSAGRPERWVGTAWVGTLVHTAVMTWERRVILSSPHSILS